MRASIQCSDCDQAAIPAHSGRTNYRNCESHFLEHVARTTLGDASLGPMLLELFNEQGRRCALTGEPLDLGINASVDHKWPQSRRPDLITERSNLHWVARWVNATKSNRSLEEFAIYARQRLAFHEAMADKFRKIS